MTKPEGQFLEVRVWRYRHEPKNMRRLDVLKAWPHPSPYRAGDLEYQRILSSYASSDADVRTQREDMSRWLPMLRQGDVRWELETTPRRCSELECDDCQEGR